MTILPDRMEVKSRNSFCRGLIATALSTETVCLCTHGGLVKNMRNEEVVEGF